LLLLSLLAALAAIDSVITSGIAARRSTGATLNVSFSHLVKAYADLKQFDDAWRRIGEATTTVGAKEESG
jgi:hypothetical protein